MSTRRSQKTQDELRPTKSLLDTALTLTDQSVLPGDLKQLIVADLAAYGSAYPKQAWKQSGRLARLGLPPSIVLPLRHARQGLQTAFAKLRVAKRAG